jgi:hypothetical protein
MRPTCRICCKLTKASNRRGDTLVEARGWIRQSEPNFAADGTAGCHQQTRVGGCGTLSGPRFVASASVSRKGAALADQLGHGYTAFCSRRSKFGGHRAIHA